MDLIYNVELISAVWQSDSAIFIYTHTHIYIFSFLLNFFFFYIGGTSLEGASVLPMQGPGFNPWLGN